MRSNKSIIRTTAAALAIGIGLAAFGGTALANPGYHPQGGWQHQGHQQWQQQSHQQNNWQRHGWQHQGNYQQSRYNGHQGQNGWQHQRWGQPHDNRQNGRQHQHWGQPHYNREGYHVTGTQGYYAPSALAFSINIPLTRGQYGH